MKHTAHTPGRPCLACQQENTPAPKRCAQMVMPRGRFYMPVPPHRCERKAEPGSRFCKQHNK